MLEGKFRRALAAAVQDFHLPKYDAIPDDGLYLEQAALYVTEVLTVLPGTALTGSMVSNYVKKGLLANPVRRKYHREQLAQLIFIAVAKSVLSIEDIRLLVQLQRAGYDGRLAYETFRSEFGAALHSAFDAPPAQRTAAAASTSPERAVLHTAVVTIAHKLCLNQSLADRKSVV